MAVLTPGWADAQCREGDFIKLNAETFTQPRPGPGGAAPLCCRESRGITKI